MAAGIRTNELRKVYNTAPPLAAGGGGFAFAEKRKQEANSQSRKSLRSMAFRSIFSRRNLRPARTERRGQVHDRRHSHHARPAHCRPGLDRRARRLERTGPRSNA